MYSAGVTGHDVTPFISIFSRRHLFFSSSLAEVNVARQKGNLTFLEDYKSESQGKSSF